MKRSPLRKESIAEIPKKKRKAWKIFSAFIRKRSGGICYTCGAKKDWKELQASHYINKSLSNKLYFDPVNVQACCYRCNIWLLGNLDAFNEHLIKDYGHQEIERLRKDKREYFQFTHAYLNDIIKAYGAN